MKAEEVGNKFKTKKGLEGLPFFPKVVVFHEEAILEGRGKGTPFGEHFSSV